MIDWKTFEYEYNGIKITLDWWAKHFLCKKFKTTENYLIAHPDFLPKLKSYEYLMRRHRS